MLSINYLSLIFLILLTEALFMLFGNISPDIYIFVRWAIADNVTRDISLQSIISNNFIFDLLVVIGDQFKLSSKIDWVFLIVIATLIVNFVKYFALSYFIPSAGVIQVFLASFVLDLNQLRFNLALTLLLLSFLVTGKFFKVNLAIASFLSHIVPFIIYASSLVSRNLGLFFFPIIVGAVLSLYLFADQLIEFSRIFGYLNNDHFYLPKILLVFIPSAYYLIFMRSRLLHYPFCENIYKMCTPMLAFGLAISPLNINLTARFFEVTYVLVNLLSTLHPISKKFTKILFIFSLLIIASRIFSGVSGNEEFTKLYRIF